MTSTKQLIGRGEYGYARCPRACSVGPAGAPGTSALMAFDMKTGEQRASRLCRFRAASGNGQAHLSQCIRELGSRGYFKGEHDVRVLLKTAYRGCRAILTRPCIQLVFTAATGSPGSAFHGRLAGGRAASPLVEVRSSAARSRWACSPLTPDLEVTGRESPRLDCGVAGGHVSQSACPACHFLSFVSAPVARRVVVARTTREVGCRHGFDDDEVAVTRAQVAPTTR